MRVFGGKFPGDVAAVVLVDSSHPDVSARLHINDNPNADIEKWEAFLPILHLAASREAREFGLHSIYPLLPAAVQ